MRKIDAAESWRRFELPAVVGEGSRDVTLFRYACSLQALGVADGEIMALCQRANAEHLVPPLPDHEVRAKVRSATRYEKGAGRAVARVPTHSPEVDDGDVSMDAFAHRRGRPDLLPEPWLGPEQQARSWLRSLFEDGDVVCLCVDPSSAAGSIFVPLRTLLDTSDPTLGDAMLDAEEVGGGLYACVNPVGGGRRADANVTAHRNVLVECDELGADEQLERICALLFSAEPRGPRCAAVTWSGNKSWHAVVRANRDGADAYARFASRLYSYCERHGLPVDRHCGNPSRLTRVAGAWRGGAEQTLRWSYATVL